MSTTSLPSTPKRSATLPHSPTPPSSPPAIGSPGSPGSPPASAIHGRPDLKPSGSFRKRMTSVFRRNSAASAFSLGAKSQPGTPSAGTPPRRSSDSLRKPTSASASTTAVNGSSLPATPAASQPEFKLDGADETPVATPLVSPPPQTAASPPQPRLDRSRLSVLGRGDYFMPSPVAESPMREAAATSEEPAFPNGHADEPTPNGHADTDSNDHADGVPNGHAGAITEEPEEMEAPPVPQMPESWIQVAPAEPEDAPSMPVPEPAPAPEPAVPEPAAELPSEETAAPVPAAVPEPEPASVPEPEAAPAFEEAVPMPEPVPYVPEAPPMPEPAPVMPTPNEAAPAPPTGDAPTTKADEDAAAAKIQRAWRRTRSSDTVVPTPPSPPPAYASMRERAAARTIQRAWRRSASSVVMPVPAPAAAPLEDPVQVAPSIRTISSVNTATERTPLLSTKRHEAQSPVGPSAPHPSALGALSSLAPPSAAALGWREHTLLDGGAYFHHAERRVTADAPLHDAAALSRVQAHVAVAPPSPPGNAPGRWEVWVRDAGKGALATLWVDHAGRAVVREKQGGGVEREDRLDAEYRYWSFVDAHPAHIALAHEAVQEATNIVSWSESDRLLPSAQTPPFTPGECRELHALLKANPFGLVHTRLVARIMLRTVQWRQRTQRPGKALPQDAGGPAPPARRHVPYGRAIADIVIGIVCLGIPFLFLERRGARRYDLEGGFGIQSPGPTLMVAASSCLMAAIILSASVTFMSLPGLDDAARIAALLAVLASTASMASTVLALVRYKLDIERTALLGGEGLLGYTRRSLLLSLPLVFVAWAAAAFATGVTLYSWKGLSLAAPGGFRARAAGFTQWTLACTLGGIAGVVLTSVVFVA